MNIIYLAYKNIVKNPLNLLLSIVLFGLGIGLITFLLLFTTQIKEKFERNLANIDLVVGAKGSPLQMILCNMYHIDNPTGNISIEKATPLLRSTHPLIKTAIPLSLGDSYKSFRIVGTNHQFLDLYGAKIEEGKLWEKDFEVVLGRSVSDISGLKIGDEFVSSHGFEDDPSLSHDGKNFKVVGILQSTGSVADQVILTNTATIWKVHDHEEEESEPTEIESHEMVDTISLYDNSNQGLIQQPSKQITSILIQYKNKTNFQALNFGRNINENTEMQAASPAIEINRLYSLIGVGADALYYIAIIIGLVSVFSIFITLFKSMRERRYELAIIRVLGASKSKVFLLIILEGMILALMGFLFGTLISHLGMESLASLLQSDFRYSFTGFRFIPEEWYVLLISLLLGFVAAIIPAWQASRDDINKTLSES